MKKFIALMLVGMLCLSFVGCGMVGKPQASPIEDFEYFFKDGEVTITGYIGTDLEIVVPDTIEDRPVRYIGAFYEGKEKGVFEDYDMTSITVPEGVRLILSDSFEGCKMLEEIHLPDSMQGFYSNNDYVADDSGYWGLCDTKWYENQECGLLYIENLLVCVKEDESEISDSQTKLSDVQIKNGTKVIFPGVFEGQEDLVSVNIPNSIEYIGKNAFRNCTSLFNITVPDGVILGNNVFDGNIYGEYTLEEAE